MRPFRRSLAAMSLLATGKAIFLSDRIFSNAMLNF